MSIRLKVLLSITLIFVVGAGVIVLALNQNYTKTLNAETASVLSGAQANLDALQQADTNKLASTLAAKEADPKIRDLYLARDRNALFAYVSPQFAAMKKDFQITHWYFERPNPPGTIFLRVHKPAQFDDVLKRKTYLQSVKTGGYASGLELGATAVALRVVHPYYAADGTTIIGYMELGEEIASFVKQLNQQTGDQYGLYLKKSGLDEKSWSAITSSTPGAQQAWTDAQNWVLVGSTDAWGETSDSEAGVPASLSEPTSLGQKANILYGAVPIKDAGGDVIGVLAFSHDVGAQVSALSQAQTQVLGIILAMLVILAVAVAILMNALIFNRLKEMTAHMEETSTLLAGGSFDVSYDVKNSTDEIGQFEAFFAQFIGLIASTMRQLTNRP